MSIHRRGHLRRASTLRCGSWDTPRRTEHTCHLPPELRDQEIAPEQLFAEPCSGYGTVYVHKGRDLHRRVVWFATWVDEITADTTGIDQVEGTRETVLAWPAPRPPPRT
ncbi:hypothetical protein ABZ780_12420 [Micromonospora sp. NPDC047467]|uniref:hypothetical protein n=1 Tax=Micromonospora sp. NPDC047467 TaxID=3154814 RepID=UPI0033D3BAF8